MDEDLRRIRRPRCSAEEEKEASEVPGLGATSDDAIERGVAGEIGAPIGFPTPEKVINGCPC